MKDERVIITGGAGFLGKQIISHLYEDNEITVYSRDESKHYFLKKIYPKINFVIGDVRDFDRLKRACKDHTMGIFAASLKQIEACDENPEEATKTIINGSFNSRKAAEDCNLKSACFISSDKSRSATTVYGAMKYVAGESFILHPRSGTRLTTAIYGNVLNSTGSIIPLIWNAIQNRIVLNLYSEEMTRFLLSVDEAVTLVVKSLQSEITGVNVVPKIRSAKIKDIFEIYSKFGLKYELSSPRVGEKIHEIMAGSEEVRRMKYEDLLDFYIMDPRLEYKSLTFPNQEYSSRDHCISFEELDSLLAKNNYFMNK